MSNTGTKGTQSIVSLNEEDRLLTLLPHSLRDFVLFHAGDNLNVAQFFQVHNEFYGPGWAEIEDVVRKFSCDNHKEYYDGVYPGVQRKITTREGRQAGTVNKRPSLDAARMLRRVANMRSRRAFRSIAVFFSDLTGG